MYCDGSITIMCSLNVFIIDFALPCLRVKKFCQVFRVRPAHSLKVLQLSLDVNCQLHILHYIWNHSSATGRVSNKI